MPRVGRGRKRRWRYSLNALTTVCVFTCLILSVWRAAADYCYPAEGADWSEYFHFYAVCFSRDHSLLGINAGMEGCPPVVLDASSRRSPVRMRDPGIDVGSIAFSADQRFLYGVGFNDSIFLWNHRTGDLVRRCASEVATLGTQAFSPSAEVLALAPWSGEVRLDAATAEVNISLVDTATGSLIRELDGVQDCPDDAFGVELAFSGDGRYLAAISKAEIRVWDVAGGGLVKVLRDERYIRHRGIMFLPGDDRLVTFGLRIVEEDAWVFDFLLWDVGDESLLRQELHYDTRVRQSQHSNHSEFWPMLDLSADGRFLLVADDSLRLDIRDARTGALVRRREEVENRMFYSPDGDWLSFMNPEGRGYVIRDAPPSCLPLLAAAGALVLFAGLLAWRAARKIFLSGR